jgi:hypothetical protein
LLPNATIDAFDISAEQYPAESFRPANARFLTHDCFTPFPQEYHSRFDIVHARSWLNIVNDDIADKVVDHFASLLSMYAPDIPDKETWLLLRHADFGLLARAWRLPAMAGTSAMDGSRRSKKWDKICSSM